MVSTAYSCRKPWKPALLAAFLFTIVSCSTKPRDDTSSAGELRGPPGAEPGAVEVDPESVARVVAEVSTAGGLIVLPGVALFEFPAGAFTAPESVTAFTTDFPGTLGGRSEYWMIGGGPMPDEEPGPDVEPPPVPYDIRVTADALPAKPIRVEVSVPDDYLATVPPGFAPLLFAELESGGSMELHSYYEEILDSEFDPEERVLRAEVWRPDAIWMKHHGRFEIVLLIGSRKRASTTGGSR